MDRRLEWVQRNRVRRERVRPLGAALQRIAGAAAAANPPLDEVVRSVIAGCTDEMFQSHCRLRSTRDALLIEVDPPGFLYAMRIQWLGIIERALAESRVRRFVGRVRFEAGTRGESLPGVERDDPEDSKP